MSLPLLLPILDIFILSSTLDHNAWEDLEKQSIFLQACFVVSCLLSLFSAGRSFHVFCRQVVSGKVSGVSGAVVRSCLATRLPNVEPALSFSSNPTF